LAGFAGVPRWFCCGRWLALLGLLAGSAGAIFVHDGSSVVAASAKIAGVIKYPFFLVGSELISCIVNDVTFEHTKRVTTPHNLARPT
jgi:hypothetical protein